MFRSICASAAALVIAGGSLAVAGCGSSSHHAAAAAAAPGHTTTLPSGQTLVEAADHVGQASGYRISATAVVTAGTTTVNEQMQGVVAQHGNLGAIAVHETVDGHVIDLQVRIANGRYYMGGVPGLSRLAHGKHWVSFDLADLQRASGLGGLESSASSDPAQFLAYLRAVGSQITRVGTTTIDGTSTTEYTAVIDLDRYPALLPVAQRAAARESIARLESEIGVHALPVTAWVDGSHEVRRMHLQIPLCVSGTHLSMSMTMNLSDFGAAPTVQVPAASDTDDITGLIRSEMSGAQTQSHGCPSSSS